MSEPVIGPIVAGGPVGGGRRRVGTVVLTVAALFTGEALFQTLLPVSMKASGVESGLLVGVVLAISQGIGILVAPPVAAWSDARGRRVPMMAAALVSAAAMLVLAVAARHQVLVLWILPVVCYGLVRISLITMTLAVVSTTGDPLRMQGINGAAQRGSAALAALVAAMLIGSSSWSLSFMSMTVASLAVAVLASRITAGASVPDGRVVPPAASFRVSVTMLISERALRASSLLNASLISMILLGSAFYPLTLDVPPAELGRWVLTLLVTRDLTAVIVGPQFHRIAGAIGFYRILALIGVLTVAGLALTAFAGTTLGLVLPAAAMQGAAAAFGIGATNLLATHGGQAGGRALRLVATNYLNSLAALALPVLFGTLADLAGGRGVFLAGAVIGLLLMSGVLGSARGWRPAS